MAVAVVQIGVVDVAVPHRFVAVPVRMRLARWVARSVRVAMVLVVDVPVFVLHRLVVVLMNMALGKVQPEPDGHQQAGQDKARACRFMQHR